MGILNVTPDSFSDGGEYEDPSRAVERAMTMVHEGADIVDIGGESTRPGAPEVSQQEEMKRVIPVLERLVSAGCSALSVDTRKVEVARAAVECGASIINDVEASRSDLAMWQLVAESGVGYVAMHMQGQPRTMQHAPNYSEVVSEVYAFFTERLDTMHHLGIKKQQVVLDVGIGFGKDLSHNLELLRSIECFGKLERPIMLGVSRKSLFKALLGVEEPSRRLPAGLATALWAVNQGVKIIRTHDVAETVQALAMWEALQGKNQL
ncbi:MAG: dihydropteroate synthase [Verrucomicrobia bacterium]|nr:dihydropteroate synthase [Verrucomicrobiota bacterium]